MNKGPGRCVYNLALLKDVSPQSDEIEEIPARSRFPGQLAMSGQDGSPRGQEVDLHDDVGRVSRTVDELGISTQQDGHESTHWISNSSVG